jgi:O-antigen/teichoic acid export membrane protein
MVGSILAARILGKGGFGQLNLVRSTVLMFGAVAGAGLSMAATKYVAEFRDLDPLRAGRLIGLLSNAALAASSLACLACWVFAQNLAVWLFADPGLAVALRAGSMLLIANALAGVQLGALAGLEAFRAYARLIALESVLGLFFVPMGAWSFGVTGAVSSSVLAAFLVLPIKQASLNQHCRAAGIAVVRRHQWGEWLTLWDFALPSMLLSLSLQPFEWLARVMLTRQPQGFVQLGLFAAAFSWGNVVALLPSQVTGPSLPILSNLFAAGHREAFLTLLRRVAIVIVGLSACVAVPMTLFPRPIMAAYGPGFVSGWPVLLVVLAAYSIAPLSGLFRSILASTGRMWWQLGHSVIWGGTLLAAFSLLAERGALGLAFSYLAAFAVVVCTQGLSAWLALRRKTGTA